jgi:benzodiazapine receptor
MNASNVSPNLAGRQRPALAGWLALVEIAALWSLLAATLVVFWRVIKAAGALLESYFAWVSFAAFLNFTIWRMNR